MARVRLVGADDRRSAGRVASGAHVLASRLPRLALEARRVSAFVNGVHGRRRPGPGETFWQYRMLTNGEPAPASTGGSGRDQRVYVKEREWEASHSIWMWIDRSASMGFASHLAKTPKVDRALVSARARRRAGGRGREGRPDGADAPAGGPQHRREADRDAGARPGGA